MTTADPSTTPPPSAATESGPPATGALEYLPPPGYGHPYPYGYAVARRTNGMAIASMVTSAALLVFCTPLSFIGAILGHVARRQIRETGEDGDGLALAGVIIGWIGLLLPLLFVAAVVALAFASGEPANAG